MNHLLLHFAAHVTEVMVAQGNHGVTVNVVHRL
jgi:hypothetical protein